MTTTPAEFKQTALIYVLRSCHLFSGLAIENIGSIAAITVAKPLDKELQPFLRREFVLVAELGDRHSLDQFHHEIRTPGLGQPAVEDPGDVRIVLLTNCLR